MSPTRCRVVSRHVSQMFVHFADPVLASVRLAELTRKIVWDDWLATRIDTDSGKPVELIVKEASLQRRSLALGFIAVSLAAATLSRSSGSSNVSFEKRLSM